jgi:hypothetical protein
MQSQGQDVPLLQSLAGLALHVPLCLICLQVTQLWLAVEGPLLLAKMAAATAATALLTLAGRAAAAGGPAAALDSAVHESVESGKHRQTLLQLRDLPAGLAAHHHHDTHNLVCV